MSSCDSNLSEPIKPFFKAQKNASEVPGVEKLINSLNLQKHPEGGYYAETDRDLLRIPNPFLSKQQHGVVGYTAAAAGDDSSRSAMTTIFYFLTPNSPKGSFHRNKGRTVHTLQKGRGRYVLIRTDEANPGEKARVETFVVGHDVEKGERLQWIVDGDIYKASFLLPDDESSGGSQQGLLISEVSRSAGTREFDAVVLQGHLLNIKTDCCSRV